MTKTLPFQLKRTPTQHNRNHWDVYQGSAHLGSFWMACGTIYARTTNQPGESEVEQLLSHDIGWMDTEKAAQHVYDTYHQNRLRST